VVAVMTETYLAQNVSVVVEAFATFHDYPTWQAVFGQNERISSLAPGGLVSRPCLGPERRRTPLACSPGGPLRLPL
jgi:hypothetical protein